MITDEMRLERTADSADDADIGAGLGFASTLFFGVVLHRCPGGPHYACALTFATSSKFNILSMLTATGFSSVGFRLLIRATIDAGGLGYLSSNTVYLRMKTSISKGIQGCGGDKCSGPFFL